MPCLVTHVLNAHQDGGAVTFFSFSSGAWELCPTFCALTQHTE